jgi:FtsH-binding integral membrane protein
LFTALIFVLGCPGVLTYYLLMNRKVIEIIVMVVALIVWFILNPKPGTTKYAGAIVIIGVIRVVGNSMKPKQP